MSTQRNEQQSKCKYCSRNCQQQNEQCFAIYLTYNIMESGKITSVIFPLPLEERRVQQMQLTPVGIRQYTFYCEITVYI